MDMRYAELVAPMLVEERLRGAARHHVVAQLGPTKNAKGDRGWHRLRALLPGRTAGMRTLPAAGC